MLVNAVYGESVEHIERSHPLGVTLGQIVVDGYHVDAIARQGVEEYGQGSDKRLTLTSGHLGNLTLVEHRTAEQLDVVVYHFPFQVIATCRPVVVIDGFVAIDGDEILTGVSSQFAVKVGGSHDGLLVLGKATGGLFDNGENLGHSLVECFFVDVEHFLLQLVYLGEDVGTLVNRRILDGGLELFDFLFLLVGRVLNVALNVLGALAQLVVIQLLDGGIGGFHLLDKWLDEFHVAR